MTRKKRSFHPLRVVLVVLIVIAAIVVAFFAGKLFYEKASKEEEITIKDIDEKDLSTNEDTKIEVVDYKVYVDDDKDLGFNFIVATLKFATTNESLYYDLNNLTNAERDIKLGDTEGYIAKLKSMFYDISSLDIKSNIISKDKSLTANVIIPYVNKNGVLNVYNGEKLSFDLSNNVINASTLKTINHPDQKVVETDNYNVSIIETPYLSTMMTRNGEEFNSSGISIYTFEIMVNNVKDNVCIENAIFIKNGTDVENYALDSSYQSLKINNIIKEPLKAGVSGALFFDLYKNYDEEINFDGILRIKFSDSTEWVEIPTYNR